MAGAGVPVPMDDGTAIAAAPEIVCPLPRVARSGQKGRGFFAGKAPPPICGKVGNAVAQGRRRPERRPTLRERSTDLTRSNLEDLTQTSSEKVSRHPTAKTETPKAYHPLKPIIHVKQRAQCGGEIPGVDGGETDSGNTIPPVRAPPARLQT